MIITYVPFSTIYLIVLNMDYHNRAGSKKGSGGIASDAQLNLQRRKKVDDLLRQGEEIPYTFQKLPGAGVGADEEIETELRRNPYIYRNHSGKLVCKLCNTMHMSWSSVERHLSGKKHGLNVLRRGQMSGRNTMMAKHRGGFNNGEDPETVRFQEEVERDRLRIRNSGVVPECQIVQIKDEENGLTGICVKLDYNSKEGQLSQSASSADPSRQNDSPVDNFEYPPFMRIVSGLETSSRKGKEKEKDKDKDKKFLVVSYEPFENIAIEIPNNREVVVPKGDYMQENAVDELNAKCCYWDRDLRYFFVQCFFQNE